MDLEKINKAILLYEALTYTGDIDTAPDWVRIIHNSSIDTPFGSLPKFINTVLDLALVSWRDEKENEK